MRWVVAIVLAASFVFLETAPEADAVTVSP